MQKSSSTTLLLVVLVASSLFSVLFCGLYIRTAMQLRDLQRNAAVAQNFRNAFVALINDTVAYGQTHPDVNPILLSAGITNIAASAPAKPSK